MERLHAKRWWFVIAGAALAVGAESLPWPLHRQPLLLLGSNLLALGVVLLLISPGKGPRSRL